MKPGRCRWQPSRRRWAWSRPRAVCGRGLYLGGKAGAGPSRRPRTHRSGAARATERRPVYRGRFSKSRSRERQARCPAGKLNTQCSRLEDAATGKVTYRFEFSTQCHDCPLRDRCLGKTSGTGRSSSASITPRYKPGGRSKRPTLSSSGCDIATPSRARRASGSGRTVCAGRGSRGLAKVRRQNYFMERPAT